MCQVKRVVKSQLLCINKSGAVLEERRKGARGGMRRHGGRHHGAQTQFLIKLSVSEAVMENFGGSMLLIRN